MFKTVHRLKRIFNFVSFNIRTTRFFGLVFGLFGFTTARNVQVFLAILMLTFVKEGRNTICIHMFSLSIFIV